MTKEEEIALHKDLARGSQEAFQKIFETYFKVLVVFAKRFVQDLSIAEDLVQDVFVKLYEKRNTIQFHSSLKSFLFQAVHNKCIDYLRSVKVKSVHHEHLLKTADSADYTDSMLQVELEERIYQVIQSLPDQCALIFKKSRFEGKKNQEIADELSISKRTVETQISKALKRLRQDVMPYIKLLAFIVFLQF